MKRYVSMQNSTFKLNDVKTLIDEAFARIDSVKWTKAYEHVCSLEQVYWKKDNIQSKEIEPIIIRLGNDSSECDSSDSDETECESIGEGDDTEDYEYDGWLLHCLGIM